MHNTNLTCGRYICNLFTSSLIFTSMPFLVFTLLTICYLAVLSRYFSIFFFNLVASSKRLNLARFCCVPNMLRSKLLGKKIKEKRQISHLMISLSQDYISLISRSLLVAQEVRAYIAPQYVSMINYFKTIAILTFKNSTN